MTPSFPINHLELVDSGPEWTRSARRVCGSPSWRAKKRGGSILHAELCLVLTQTHLDFIRFTTTLNGFGCTQIDGLLGVNRSLRRGIQSANGMAAITTHLSLRGQLDQLETAGNVRSRSATAHITRRPSTLAFRPRLTRGQYAGFQPTLISRGCHGHAVPHDPARRTDPVDPR